MHYKNTLPLSEESLCPVSTEVAMKTSYYIIAALLVLDLVCVLSQKKGEKGDPGVMGPPGQDGQDGLRGEKGEKGTGGPQGTKGNKGKTGAVGPRGEPGLPGLSGSSGLDGESGPKGDKGAEGTPGIKGEQGIQGPPGTTGNKGDIGGIGEKGEKGSVGPRGTKGDQGVAIKGDQGIQGLAGQKGNKGHTGRTGAKGDEGRMGPKGDRGDPGTNIKGDKGLQGPRGPPGLPMKGQKGQRGSYGAQGIRGVKGMKGDRGYTGPQGGRGYTGQKGQKGQQGYYGSKGAKGECHCTQAKCGVVGNWRLVAYLDTTSNGGRCPSGLREVSSDSRYGKRACGRSVNSGCSSVTYTTSGFYSHICGRVRGYQRGTMDAFHPSLGKTINDAYVDGISITRGSPRQHVWTYAVGVSEKDDHAQYRCPCATNDYSRVPSFVGSNYYCESGFVGYREYRTAWEDTLWDGIRCEVTSNKCCNRYGWFYRRVPRTNDYLEVRWCSDQDRVGDTEDVFTDLVEIWAL